MKKLAIALSLSLALAPVVALAAVGPTITLTGGSVTLNPGSSYTEPGYSASDPTDGNITSSVVVSNVVNTSQPGSYSIGYSVTDSLSLSDSKQRSVTVLSWGSISNPCTTNGTCPCPVNSDQVTGDLSAWKSCVTQYYPKLSDGSTLVCRLRPLWPWENKATCAVDQAGFGEMVISPNGTETYL